MVESRVVRRKLDGVRLLGKGELSSKISISVSGISKKAQEAVERLGGKVTLLQN